jgi:hypothetical protein
MIVQTQSTYRYYYYYGSLSARRDGVAIERLLVTIT